MFLRKTIRIFELLALLLIFLNACYNTNADLIPVKVLSLTPEPNYPLCTDPLDTQQLTDGKIESNPIWTRKGCVGWTESGPVKLLLQAGNGEKTISGKLSLHTARGIQAGVHMPSRIDIYSQEKKGEFYHVGGFTIQEEDYADRKDHWISLEVNEIHSPFFVVIRPSGSYLFIDEIQLATGQNNPNTAAHVPVGDLKACEKDSRERYRESLIAKIVLPKEISEEWTKVFGAEKEVVWVVENPYGHLPLYPKAETIKQSAKEMYLQGTRKDRENGCLGMLNLGQARKSFEISLEGNSRILAGISLRKVAKILAADGSQVFDPLLPLEEGHRLSVPAKEAAYLWIQADLRNMSPGKHKLYIIFRDEMHNIVRSIPVTLQVSDIMLPENCRPMAINWAYTNDLPIWENSQKALADLLDHGINMFVIHPSRIPMPTMNGDWQTQDSEKLASDVSLYQGKGLILLFLNWGPGKGPSWLNPLSQQDISTQKATLQTWLKKLSFLLKSFGLWEQQWALYPVDEPHGEGLPYLLELAKWVKETNPNIQLYANPITTHTHITRSYDLVKLASYIDFWQPALDCATGSAVRFFKVLPRPWLIYAGAPSPAKAASPWNDYRLLSWRAWLAGAKGIGFWSYSDTSGTTAWDDLDGRRPDFAVVYEDKNGPISSRRWEAFRKGLEDFQLLETAYRLDLPFAKKSMDNLKLKVKYLLNRPAIPFNDIESMRQDLIELLDFSGVKQVPSKKKN